MNSDRPLLSIVFPFVQYLNNRAILFSKIISWEIFFRVIILISIIYFFDSSLEAQALESNIKHPPNQLRLGNVVKSISGFIKNNGQVNGLEGAKTKNVYYTYNSGSGVDVYITNKGISYVYKRLLDKKVWSKNSASGKTLDSGAVYHYSVERVDATLLHANIDTLHVQTEYCKDSATFSYYEGRTQITGQRLINKIVFKNVYKGIDWVLYEANGDTAPMIKYDFVIHEGANPDEIELSYSPNVKISFCEDSGLTIKSRFGYIKEGAPLVFSGVAKKAATNIHYTLKNNIVRYSFDRRSISYPFTIDPDLTWGTFLRSVSPYDGLNASVIYASDVETDRWGNVFVALASAGRIGFPTKNPGGGAYYESVYDNFPGANIYMKFSEAGVLLWSTYFATGGGRNVITVDNAGNLIVAGNFSDLLPLKNNGGYFDSSSSSQRFLAKFNNSGVLIWCTRWAFQELLFSDITNDKDDNFYLTGTSPTNVLPKKDPGNGAYFVKNTEYGSHIFITKFDQNCKLLWSTEIGGNDYDDAARVAVDKFRNVYVLGATIRSTNYPLQDAGGYFQKEGISILTRFDSNYHLVWSTYVPDFASDIATDTSGNVYEVGSAHGGRVYPYVDPGNGAYMDPNPQEAKNGGNIMKFDINTKAAWSTTYYGGKNYFFQYINFEKYRNLIHIYGFMNDYVFDLPTVNDGCNGTYYYPSTKPNTLTDPLLLTFTTEGKRLYTSLNGFPYAYYNISEFTVDRKGNLIYVFGQIQQAGPLVNFPTLKDPGNGAFYQPGVDNYLSNGSFLMELRPSLLNADTSYILPGGCSCTGSITVTPRCGSGSYKYLWSRGDTTSTIMNVCPGHYTVRVTDQGSLADTTIDFFIPNPPENVHGARTTTLDAHCNGSDGALIITNVKGNAGPYLYSFSDQPYATGSRFNNLSAGIYHFNVKDKDGCIYSDSAIIRNVPGPSSIFSTSMATGCTSVNGSIIIDSVKDGTSPFTYAIGNNAPQNKNGFSGLTKGTYKITVNDSAGCVYSDSVEVKQALPPSSFAIDITNVHCNGGDGALAVHRISGGNGPYLFSLDSASFVPDSVFHSLTAGANTVYVKDINGCIAMDTAIILTIPGPQKMWFRKEDALCGAVYGNITIDSVTGGVSPYTYAIDNGFYLSNAMLKDILPGKHVLYAKDQFGCTAVDSAVIVQTPELHIAVTPKDTLVCVDGEVLFTPLTLSNNAGVRFYWNGSSSATPYYEGAFLTDTKIILHGIDEDGCSKFDTGIVTVKYCDSLMANCVRFPTAFTPNHDGLNDVFGVHSSSCEIKNYRLMVYNRWGQIVFTTTNPLQKWDGTFKNQAAQMGTFVYFCQWEDASGVIRHLKGAVSLLR